MDMTDTTGAKDADGLPVVDAFEPGRDVIVVELGTAANADPDITMRREPDCDVLSLDGVDVARIHAAAGAAPGADDVRLVFAAE